MACQLWVGGEEEEITKAWEKLWMKWVHMGCVGMPTLIRLHTLHMCGLFLVTDVSVEL